MKCTPISRTHTPHFYLIDELVLTDGTVVNDKTGWNGRDVISIGNNASGYVIRGTSDNPDDKDEVFGVLPRVRPFDLIPRSNVRSVVFVLYSVNPKGSDQ